MTVKINRSLLWTLLIVALIIFGGALVYGFTSGQISLPDNPDLSEGEVLAIVKNDLLNQGVISSPDFIKFSGQYIGDGKWSGIYQGYYTYEENVTTYEYREPTIDPDNIYSRFKTDRRVPSGSYEVTREVKRTVQWNYYEKLQITDVVQLEDER